MIIDSEVIYTSNEYCAEEELMESYQYELESIENSLMEQGLELYIR